MTYFQLYDSLQSASSIRGSERERTLPSSSFLLNPALLDPASTPTATARPQLRPKLYLVPSPVGS